MSITNTSKKLLCELVGYKCEECKKENKSLVIHRIRRGNMGGTYEHRNCMVLCTKCHGKFHGNEFGWCQGK